MIQPKGVLHKSKHVHDTKIVKLTWTERLMTWPWKPWVATKEIPKTNWISDKHGGVLCSIETYQRLTRMKMERDRYEMESRN